MPFNANLTKISIGALALLAAFAFGRYSIPASSTKLTEVKHVDTKVDEAKDTHVVTHTIVTKQPTGATVTDTITTTDVVLHQDTSTVMADKVVSQTTAAKRSKINISTLAATQVGSNFGQPLYGISAQKEFIGPITVGAFALTNGTIGVSLGLDF